MTIPADNPATPGAGRILGASFVVAAAVAVSACTAQSPATESATNATTVMSCGTELRFDTAPTRVVITMAEPISLLDAVDATDSVIARAGIIPTGTPAHLRHALESIPAFSEDIDATGHALLSTEQLLAQQPDLIIGAPSSIDIPAMAAAGIPVYTPPEYCDHGSNPGATTHTDRVELTRISEELTTYGAIFHSEQQAREAITTLDADVAHIPQAPQQPNPPRAAALYVTPGSDTVYAYGAPSIYDPIIRATGMTPVFGELPQRVGEVSIEQLVDHNPDVLILAFDSAHPVDVAAAFQATPTYQAIAAARPAGSPPITLIPLDYQLSGIPAPTAIAAAHHIGDAVASR